MPGGEIETPFPVGSIEVAGDTILIQGKWDENGKVADTEFALVRGDQLETIPAAGADGMGLSLDGRIAFWETPTQGTMRFVAWDTETNTELASREVPGWPEQDSNTRLGILGIDADGIAYWVDEASTPGHAVGRSGRHGGTDPRCAGTSNASSAKRPRPSKPSAWTSRMPSCRPMARGRCSPDVPQGTRPGIAAPPSSECVP